MPDDVTTDWDAPEPIFASDDNGQRSATDGEPFPDLDQD